MASHRYAMRRVQLCTFLIPFKIAPFATLGTNDPGFPKPFIIDVVIEVAVGVRKYFVPAGKF